MWLFIVLLHHYHMDGEQKRQLAAHAIGATFDGYRSYLL